MTCLFAVIFPLCVHVFIAYRMVTDRILIQGETRRANDRGENHRGSAEGEECIVSPAFQRMVEPECIPYQNARVMSYIRASSPPV